MPLHIFVSGESAGVAANLDANFLYLLGLIQGGARGNASGLATVNAISGIGLSSTATASGAATAAAVGAALSLNQSLGSATGLATVSGFAASNVGSTASATGSSNVQAYFGGSSVFSSTGSATVSGVGGHMQASAGSATGTVTVLGVGLTNAPAVALATGVASGNAVGQGSQAEAVNGAVASQPAQSIFASSVPGNVSPNLNSFSLPSNPGQVAFNGTTDTASQNVNIVELYYQSHTIYFQNASGIWFSWVSANTWASAPSPLPVAPPMESIEGTIVTVANPSSANNGNIIYGASLANGSPAAAGATVGNGLDSWALTANPGQILFNGVIVPNSANVTELYYHNHYLYQFGGGAWYQWTITGPASGYVGPSATSPVPATPTINVTPIANQAINSTVTVSGNYQLFAGPGVPSLQYSNNGGAYVALPSPSITSVGTPATGIAFSFVHPPITTNAATYTIAVRDAATTGIVATSNPFQVVTPGLVTLLSMSLGNTTASSGPAGTIIGPVTVQVAGGAFSGTVTVSGTNAANFQVSGGNLVTTSVLGAGSYGPITLTAVQNAAAGSPLTAGPYTIVISAESQNGVSVTTVGPSIIGSITPGTQGSTVTWVLVAATAPATGFQIRTNGVLQTASNNVVQMYYINHTLYQLNSSAAWYVFLGTIDANGQAGFASSNSPLPVLTLINNQAAPNNGFSGEVSVVSGASSGVHMQSVAGLTQCFTLQMYVAGSPLPFAKGPTTYAITGGAQASSFSITVDAISFYVNAIGSTPLGAYALTITATY